MFAIIEALQHPEECTNLHPKGCKDYIVGLHSKGCTDMRVQTSTVTSANFSDCTFMGTKLSFRGCKGAGIVTFWGCKLVPLYLSVYVGLLRGNTPLWKCWAWLRSLAVAHWTFYFLQIDEMNKETITK